MKVICMAMIAYLLLEGVAQLWRGLLGLSPGEGMIPGAATVAAVLYAAGLGGHFQVGIWCLAILGIAGFALGFWRDARRGGGKRLAEWASPYFVLLTLLFAGSLLLYHGDFIWHIDELHLYAGAPKYMLEHGKLPLDVSYLLGAKQYLSTSLFHYFFQHFTGYNEGVMYASGALLTWIGALLPFAGSKEERPGREEALLYTAILYVGIYSLYIYGTKNLYVDLPAAAWAGGLAAWWVGRKAHTRGQCAVAAVGVLMVHLFKPQIGLLLAVLTLLFGGLDQLLQRWQSAAGRQAGKGSPVKRGLLAVLILLAAVLLAGLLFVWRAGGGRIGMGAFAGRMVQALHERLRPTTIAFLSALVGTSLSTRSALSLTLPFVTVLIGLLLVLGGRLRQEKARGMAYVLYALAALAMYLAALYGAFLFIFSYEESVQVAGIRRYLTDILLYLLIIALVWMLSARRAWSRYAAAGLLLFFLLGVNEHYIPNMTAIDKANAAGYKDIKKTRQTAGELKKELEETDRVYFLNQAVDNEYPVNTALYYLGDQVSNYLTEPWKFTPDGSMIRLREADEPSIRDLPGLLREGGYTYLWIYSSDDYLREAGAQLFGGTELEEGIYQLVYTQNGTVSAKALDERRSVK